MPIIPLLLLFFFLHKTSCRIILELQLINKYINIHAHTFLSLKHEVSYPFSEKKIG